VANEKHLSIYLNDHLAGATAGIELAKRTLGSNRDGEFGPVLERLVAEIEEDRATLREVMRELGVGEDTVKKVGAFVAEKVGRLKLNGSVFSYSPLSRLVEFEGLALGIAGKLALWRALQEVGDPRLDQFDLPRLEERAGAQQQTMEEQRRKAARLALED
jgi:hypothetical protein